MPPRQRPTRPVGLYDPAYEHDACGVAFVARLSGEPSHETVRRAITALENLEHRGAAGADPNTGDGAGILMQLPDEFLRGVIGAELPPAGQYGVAVCFLPQEEERRHELERLLADTVEAEGQRVVTWRDIPVEKDYVGITANWFAPYIKQLVVAASDDLAADQDAFERKLYVIRRVAELAAGPDLVIPSFSSRTIVYKGMLTAPQLLGYYPDLQDERTKAALALVHSRFSTNTFPSWELAHPYRMIAHNGEINTLRGNVNWMRARESQLRSELFGDDLEKVLPVVRPGRLGLGDVRQRARAARARRPQPPARADDDGAGGVGGARRPARPPAGVLRVPLVPDGAVGRAGRDLLHRRPRDRRDARPQRAPARPLDGDEGRLGRARLGVRRARRAGRERAAARPPRSRASCSWSTSTRAGSSRTTRSSERVAGRRPYGEWYENGVVRLEDLPDRQGRIPREPLRTRQLAFGYSQEDLRILLAPMAAKGEEPIGSMGNDISLAVLSDQAPSLFAYFKQLFAQVTNPPIDPIRESVVMSIRTGVGSEPNLLTEGPEHAHQLEHPAPDPAQPRARGAARRRLVRLPLAHDPDHLARRRRAGGAAVGRAADLRAGGRGDRLRREHHRAVRPRRRPDARRDPVAARRLRRPPPPRPRGDAAAGGAGARIRRAARDPPLRDADRLRRLRDQPVPDARVARGRRRAGRARAGASATSSRRSARACSRRSRRWGSRRSSPTTGRRSSRPSGSRAT